MLRTMFQQLLRYRWKQFCAIVSRIGGKGGAVDRGQAVNVPLTRVGASGQEPRHHLFVRLLGGDMQRRGAVEITGVD